MPMNTTMNHHMHSNTSMNHGDHNMPDDHMGHDMNHMMQVCFSCLPVLFIFFFQPLGLQYVLLSNRAQIYFNDIYNLIDEHKVLSSFNVQRCQKINCCIHDVCFAIRHFCMFSSCLCSTLCQWPNLQNKFNACAFQMYFHTGVSEYILFEKAYTSTTGGKSICTCTVSQSLKLNKNTMMILD